jgi:membrane fusion protein (multidrug efflux system)
VITLAFGLIGALYFFYWAFYARFYETTDDAYVRGNNVPVMSQIPGHVNAIFADETDAVTKGQKVIQLDTLDAEIALKIAKAQLALTARQVSQFYHNVEQLRANVEVAKDNLDKVNEDLKRRQGLVVNKTISSEELQHANNAYDNARDALELAKQQLAASFALIGETDLYHHPQIEQAAVNVRNAYLNLQRTIIYAPVTGYVAKRPVQVGQQINTNTVLMVIVPLDRVWIDANFKESQLKHIRIGQNASVTADAYGSELKYQGTVVGLSPGTGSSFDLLPPQNATGNWIKVVQRLPVRIAIDAKQLEKFPLRVGLSTIVEVDTHNRKGQTLSQSGPIKMIYESIDYAYDLQEADKIIDTILKENAKKLHFTKEP